MMAFCFLLYFSAMEFHENLHDMAMKEGLKGRKLHKAVESFTWNITILKVSTVCTVTLYFPSPLFSLTFFNFSIFTPSSFLLFLFAPSFLHEPNCPELHTATSPAVRHLKQVLFMGSQVFSLVTKTKSWTAHLPSGLLTDLCVHSKTL